MKTILLHCNEDDAFKDRLAVALDVARAFDAHLTCLHVTPYNAYMGFDPVGGAMLSGSLLQDLRARETAFRSATEAHLAREDVRWDWEAADGDPGMTLVRRAALADLVVVSQVRPGGAGLGKPPPLADDVVVHAGCATLVVPQGCGQFDPTGTAVVAWNGSPEAAHAIRQARALLTLAASVHLVVVGEDGADFPQMDANAYLSRHGIACDVHTLGKGRADEILLQFAREKGASMLVMGAYGHSRLRETVIGGVTRHMLTRADVPLVMGH